MTVDSKSGKRNRVVCHNNSFLCLRLANELLLAVCLPLGLHGARGDTNAHSIDLLSLLSHPRRLWFVGGLEDLCPSHARSHGCAQRPARRLRLLYIPPPHQRGYSHLLTGVLFAKSTFDNTRKP